MKKIILILFLHLSCFANQHINKLLQTYTRPVTILYVSNKPEWLNVRESDVVVYWTQNKPFLEEVQVTSPDNVIVLTAPINQRRIKSLSSYDFFDIVIYKCRVDTKYVRKHCHMADYTIFIDPQESNNSFLHEEPYTKLSYYKKGFEYKIQSNAHEKILINREGKKIPLIPGLSCRTYFTHLGKYPSEQRVLEETIDKANPFFNRRRTVASCIRNKVVTGAALQGIDYSTKVKKNPLFPDLDVPGWKRKALRLKLGG